MPTEHQTCAIARGRIASCEELTRFYRAIGISAVASATQAAKMTVPAKSTSHELPAFLRDAHAVG
jgi:hypothetical protein